MGGNHRLRRHGDGGRGRICGGQHGHGAYRRLASCLSSGHPEKLVDFAYRAVHEMTVAAKAITAGYYGQGA